MKPNKLTSGKTINDIILEDTVDECVKGFIENMKGSTDYRTSLKIYLEKAYWIGYNGGYDDCYEEIRGGKV